MSTRRWLNGGAAATYLIARFTRIWLPHLACFLIAIAVLVGLPAGSPFPSYATRPITNLLLLLSWIPTTSFVHSFNPMSWTLPVEAFFYVMFPLLIVNFSRTWHWKLALSIGLAPLMSGIASTFQLPPAAGPSGSSISIPMGFNPLSRLFEFVAGMRCCLAWRKYQSKMPTTLLPTTLLELAAVAFMQGPRSASSSPSP